MGLFSLKELWLIRRNRWILSFVKVSSINLTVSCCYHFQFVWNLITNTFLLSSTSLPKANLCFWIYWFPALPKHLKTVVEKYCKQKACWKTHANPSPWDQFTKFQQVFMLWWAVVIRMCRERCLCTKPDYVCAARIAQALARASHWRRQNFWGVHCTCQFLQ